MSSEGADTVSSVREGGDTVSSVREAGDRHHFGLGEGDGQKRGPSPTGSPECLSASGVHCTVWNPALPCELPHNV